MNNYESARLALAFCKEHFKVGDDWPVEMLLPADDSYTVCSPEHLAAALGLSGLACVLYETPAVGAVVHRALSHGHLAICLVGLHREESQQNWMVADTRRGPVVGFFAPGEFAAPLAPPEPAHFRALVIEVFGPCGSEPTYRGQDLN